MTLRAMAIAARAVRNLAVAAPVALLDMTTEGRRAADRNRPQRLLLLIRERISKRRQVSRAVEAENVALHNHPFLDGNKRIGFVLGVLFLEMNGYRLTASEEDATQAVLGLT